MRIETWNDVDSLILNAIPEGPSLEYKAALALGPDGQRVEAMKDLTGMGNGGGGTLIYGVHEDPANEGVPAGTRPLEDRSLVGVLEDIVRSSVRPPLLFNYRVLEGTEGFLLVVDVARSPLGPYMVEGYGQRRFFIRVGSRTAPMQEQHVRDAYALAIRGREHRADTWAQHHLPVRPMTNTPWLTLSALPEEPLVDLFDPAKVEIDELRLPPEMQLLPQVGGYDLAAQRLEIWADGVYGDDGQDGTPTRSVLRLHRDGAAGLGVGRYTNGIPLYDIERALNAQVIYLAWFWNRFGLRTPVELQARMENLAEATVQFGAFQTEERRVREPSGVSVPEVVLRREFLAHELARASVRHTLVRDFGDRLHQAFGLPRAEVLFRMGWLYGRDGNPLGLSIGGSGVWDQEGMRRGRVYQSGKIRTVSNDGVVAQCVDGVVSDQDGRVLAAVEMAPGTGQPDSFVPKTLTSAATYVVHGGNPGEPLPDTDAVGLPSALGEWSERSLAELLPLQTSPT